MRRSLLAVLPLGLLAACDGDPGTKVVPFEPADPSTCAVYLWEPGDGELETWPSMEYLVEDASTATGYTFSMTEERFPALATFGAHRKVAIEQLPTLDGFGIHGANLAQFSRPFDGTKLPAPDGAAHAEDPAGIVVFAADGTPSLLPVSLSTVPDTVTEEHLLVATPMFPLPELARAAFFVTKRAEAATGDGCIGTSEGMHGRLQAPDAQNAEAIDALVALGVIADASELVVLQPYVTQSIVDESLAVAADIASRPDEDFAFTLDPPQDCSNESGMRHCVAHLTTTDYRNAEGFLQLDESGAAVRHTTYELEVHIWIPTTNAGPSSLFLVGHGLGGSALEHAGMVLDAARDSETVVVAIDALEHGAHPTADGTGVTQVMNFFAVDLGGPSVDALRLRENFRQSTYDKLQVTRAILANVDLDGDGTDDVDPSRMAYLGVSLGAIMGSELLALTDAYGAGVLSMAGGRVSDIINDPESDFSSLKGLLLPSAVLKSPAETAKLFAVLQTVLDRGDAASYAAHVLRDRFDEAPEVPDLLMLAVVDDSVVPNAENYYFARAAGLSIVPQVLESVPGLEELPEAPVAGNLPGGGTAGLLQFDVVEEQGGDVVTAEHGNMTQSVTGMAAITEFVQSKWEDGTARIIDPYVTTGLPHAP